MASGTSPPSRPTIETLPGQPNPQTDVTLVPPQSSQPTAESTSTHADPEKSTEQKGTAATPSPLPAPEKLGGVKKWISVIKDRVAQQAEIHKVPLFYVPRISGTVILLVAPWIFYAVVHHKGHLSLGPSAADHVAKNPRTTTLIVVTLSGIIAAIVTILFGSALVCIVQKQTSASTTDRKHNVRVRHLGRVASLSQLKLLFAFNSRDAIIASILALLLFLAGNQLVAGISAMFAPQPITLITSLTGREIDLSVTDPACKDWYADPAHAPPQNCGYQTVNDFVYTSCLGENQLSDVIQAGRDNAAFPNSSLPTTFPRMNGIRFFGPYPGVLVPGPDGLNRLSSVSPGDPMAFADSPTPERSYNYTVPLQGVSLHVTCSSESSTIINASVIEDPTLGRILEWTASCPVGTSDILNLPGNNHSTPVANQIMMAWACKHDNANSSSLGYSIYLQGANTYQPSVGKMTCNVDAALAEYTVEWRGTAEYFETTAGPTNINNTGNSSNVFANVFDEVVRRNVDVVLNGQTSLLNPVTEAMLAIGAEYYGLSNQSLPNAAYPAIMSSILQSMLNYQAGYLRVIYSGADATLVPLTQCFRDITGSVSYPWIGWSTGSGQFEPAFLAAYTTVLLLSLALYGTALHMEEPYDGWNPTDPTEVAAAAFRNELRSSGSREGDMKDAIVTRGSSSEV